MPYEFQRMCSIAGIHLNNIHAARYSRDVDGAHIAGFDAFLWQRGHNAAVGGINAYIGATILGKAHLDGIANAANERASIGKSI